MKNQTTVEKAVQAEEIVKEEVTECKDAAEKPAKKPAKAKKAAPAKEAAPSNVRANITIEYQFRNTTIQSIMDKIAEKKEKYVFHGLAVNQLLHRVILIRYVIIPSLLTIISE